MKHIYVDEILQNKESTPAPTNYNLKSSFGVGGEGSRYSMRPKLNLFDQHLKKQGALPGPGHHVTGQNLDLSGKTQAFSKLHN
jgi:hypothetical protein